MIKGSSTIHYTELPDSTPDDPLYHEYITYRRELPRWLAEGFEGKVALIKGTTVLGIFDSFEEGYKEGLKQFLFEPFMVQHILEWQPLITCTWMVRPCLSLRSLQARTE